MKVAEPTSRLRSVSSYIGFHFREVDADVVAIDAQDLSLEEMKMLREQALQAAAGRPLVSGEGVSCVHSAFYPCCTHDLVNPVRCAGRPDLPARLCRRAERL